MTITERPWVSATSGVPNVHLVVLEPAVLHALGQGDSALAASLSAVELSPYLLGGECRSLWRYRSGQIERHPTDLVWVTRLLIDADTAVAVGVAGFHGPPDENGMVELGYRVEPRYRRRGYARAALETLLATSASDPRVRIVRATISPENTASRALIDQYGFTPVGEQWDEEDGLEIILEVAASA